MSLSVELQHMFVVKLVDLSHYSWSELNSLFCHPQLRVHESYESLMQFPRVRMPISSMDN